VTQPSATLYQALAAVPLAAAGGALFQPARESVVLLLPRTLDIEGGLTLEAQGALAQAANLLAAAAAVGRVLDVVLLPLYSRDLQQAAGDAEVAALASALPQGARLLRTEGTVLVDGNGTPTPLGRAFFDLEEAFFGGGFGNLGDVAGRLALHRPADATALAVVRSAEIVGNPFTDLFAQVRVLGAPLEAALDATGPNLSLPPPQLLPEFPPVTTPPGAYDAVGETVPNLTFTDASGAQVTLRGLGTSADLIVLSVCAE
jgi:hypothetical protein